MAAFIYREHISVPRGTLHNICGRKKLDVPRGTLHNIRVREGGKCSMWNMLLRQRPSLRFPSNNQRQKSIYGGGSETQRLTAGDVQGFRAIDVGLFGLFLGR